MKKPVFIAHRGVSKDALENSLLTFDIVYRLRTQMFELDVHETADNHLACIRDHTVNRTTDGRGLFSEIHGQRSDIVRICTKPVEQKKSCSGSLRAI